MSCSDKIQGRGPYLILLATYSEETVYNLKAFYGHAFTFVYVVGTKTLYCKLNFSSSIYIIIHESQNLCLYLDQIKSVVVVDRLCCRVCPIHTVECETFRLRIWLEEGNIILWWILKRYVCFWLYMFWWSNIWAKMFNEYLVWVVYWADICWPIRVHYILEISKF